MIDAAVDTDILLKGARYDLLECLIRAIPATPNTIGILGAARFMVAKRLERVGGTQVARNRAEAVFKVAQILEPNDDESSLAAELERLAQIEKHNLDEGESQLIAIVILRKINWLVTGDKRALSALWYLRNSDPKCCRLDGRIIILELLLLRLMDLCDPAYLRERICACPDVDRTLSICFSCTNPAATEESWRTGLNSYLADAEKKAAPLLAK